MKEPKTETQSKNSHLTGKQSQVVDDDAVEKNKYFVFARYVLVATLVVAAVAGGLYFIWYAAELLLLVFAGVLVSILLRGISRYIRSATGIGHSFSISLVALTLLALIIATTYFVAGRLGTQTFELQQQLPTAFENLKGYIVKYDWLEQALASLPSIGEWFTNRSSTIISQITGLASTTVSGFLNTIVVFIIGLYLAFQPELYSSGIKHLLPFQFRDRAGEIFSTVDEALSRWLIGRVVLMSINGALTGLGLWILDVPMALTLGLICGLLNFIPNFGPWIAALPAVMIAFLQSPQQALYVVLLYVVLQSLDGYVFTPLIDRKSVELPPVITITAQILLGIAFGFLGLLLASPLAATLMILIKMLYVEDVLDDPVMEESEINANDSKTDDDAEQQASPEET